MYLLLYNSKNHLMDTSEPWGNSTIQIKIDEFHDVYRNTPMIEIDGTSYELCVIHEGIYYDGIYYCDYRVIRERTTTFDLVKFDVEKTIPKTHSMGLHNSKLAKAFWQLYKNVDGIDGETMEHMINELGMRSQMLRQLVLGSDKKDILELLEEKDLLEKS